MKRRRARKRRSLGLRFEKLESRSLCAADWQNAINPPDVDQSGIVEPLDALIVINELFRHGIQTLSAKPSDYNGPLLDVSGDTTVSSFDVLLVINALSVVNVGSIAPDVRLPNQEGEMVDLASFAGEKDIVLYFYPKDNTPGCTAEAIDFSARKNEIESLGAKIFGVSLDSVQSHEGFADTHKLEFDILADTNHDVTSAFGVMGQTLNGEPIAKRTTFIIGRDGIVKKVFSNVQVASHGANVVAALRALADS